ncbi:terminase TerL endonuclease subunit [Clostridium sp. YIM B02500]|uniref:terminase large subunit n=1 Tax=Clostridium sp. YIM B02500 TaxID=2910681 RepID=UPI001EED597A|nr:terminase TerL endonuclease subunit [Clostridium sp. YIM B02500]
MSNTARKIIYELTYNPILEYWEKIKHKPLFQKRELLKKEIVLLKNDKVTNEVELKSKEKELEEAIKEIDKLKLTDGIVNVSLKVYKTYKELVRLINDDSSEWEYNPKKANHALEFIENYCKHSKGSMGGKPFILELWQKALVAATFGIIHKIDGTRKYQEVLLVVARKNGKSTLSAAIGLYLQIADGEPGSEIYAVATKKDQAKIIWLEAKRMVKKSPSLIKRIKPLVGEMTSEFNDSFFKPLGRDSDSLDGLNVHGALLDEIHAWTDQNLYDVIVDGTTAREQPLIFVTTTAGTVRECVYDLKYDESERLINGYEDSEGYKNERFLAIVYELDDRDEWTDEECWTKANPGLGTIKKIDQLQNKVNKAKANSKLIKNLLCKDFNIRETNGEAWLSFEDINNTEIFDMEDIRNTYAIGGCDLSATTDLTCATLLIMKPNSNKKYILQQYFLPEELLDKRVQEDKIPYDLWRDRGLLTTCEGFRVNFSDVTAWYEKMLNEYDITPLWIYYDRALAGYWVEEMKGKGFQMYPCAQGALTFSQPMRVMEADLKSKLINYNNNPILKWCLTNTSVKYDDNDNIRPLKGRNQRQRIDGMVSLLDAYVGLGQHSEEYINLVG